MKKLFTTLTILIFTNVIYSQVTVKIEDASKLKINDQLADKTVIRITNDKPTDNDDKTKDIKLTDFAQFDENEKSFGSIKYQKVAASKQIIFWIDKQDKKNAEAVYYCETEKIYTKNADCKAATNGNSKKDDEVALIDFPLKKYDAKSNENKLIVNNRTIIIDSKSDKCMNCDETGLYKFVKEDTDKKCKLIKAEALPVNRYLSVMIKNYNFYDIERFTITANAESYKYDQDIQKVYDLVAKKDPGKGDSKAIANQEDDSKTKTPQQEEMKVYLNNVLNILKDYEYLNLNDLYKVEEYKMALNNYASKHKDEFDSENNILKNNIASWYPKYVSLTPISIDIPDNDEVKLTYSLKAKGIDAETKSLGNFKTFGSVSVDYGAAFYLTDLRNNEVYTKTTGSAADNNEDTRAYLASSNEDSVGFGLNIDISYRTGLHFRPTFNFGFFVPLEEEISPFIATGPGIGFYSKNYKVNLSWGISLGKINSIKEQYRDINLAGQTLTNEDLTEKVLKTGHYYSISISFNVFEPSK